MASMRVPFFRPELTPAEIDEVVATLRSGWLTTGPRAHRFEQEFAAFVGAPAALAVSSGTAALHLALLACGIGAGDAVITTPLTFCSTVHVIEQVGAHPVLVDVEPETLNLDPNRVEEALRHSGRRVRALLPVHLHGHPCDMDALLDIAHRHELAVIEDAAHALPAHWQGEMIGRVGGPVPRAVAFSFYVTKNLNTAEGGMLTASPELLRRARPWALHGIDRDAWQRYGTQGSWYYEVVQPGYKYNLSDLQAALGLVQLRRLPEMQRRRLEHVRRYQAGLGRLDGLQLPLVRPGASPSWHIFAVRLNPRPGESPEQTGERRGRFMQHLQQQRIGSSVHFIPVHLHPYYRDRYGYRPEDFPVAWREYQRMISLPLSPAMQAEDVDDVVAAVKSAMEHA